jgi:hypothetical protein
VRLFRRDKENGEEPVVPVTDAAPPVDLVRFERLVRSSIRLRELGVAYEVIEQRASLDAVSFNEALEALDREHVRG